MKMTCSQCGDRRKFTYENFPRKEINSITREPLGWICIKCSRKLLVSERAEGISWRKALRDVFTKKQIEIPKESECQTMETAK